jgi:hypothetical protein
VASRDQPTPQAIIIGSDVQSLSPSRLVQYDVNPEFCPTQSCAQATSLGGPNAPYLVTVLLTLNNLSGQAQPRADDQFMLVDAQGRAYRWRGQGSLTIPAEQKLRYLPLNFIVFADATNLVLIRRDRPDRGWLVLASVRGNS